MGELQAAGVAIGAGIAIGGAAFGSGIGQGTAAAAGVGATAENEKLFGKAIVMAALPETQAIYGLIISILLIVLIGAGA